MTPGPPQTELAARLEWVRDGIADAARAAGRSAEDIRLIAVTKFQPAELVAALWELGVRDFGENRHQEARIKAAGLPEARWHFVGQLQSNKARQVAGYAAVIHSVDRSSLVAALAGGPPVECFVQVNLDGGPGRGGVEPAGLEPLVEDVLAAPALRLRGVMAVAPLGAEPRAAFARLRDLSERVRRLAPDARAISAGMSHDYPEAVAEGATHLRIGTAITGNRPRGR